MELVRRFPAWGEVPALLFTTLAFDLLLFSPQPAEGQTVAEPPAGGGGPRLPSCPFFVPQRQARLRPGHSLDKHSSSLSYVTSHHPPNDPGCRQSRGIMPLILVRELKLREVK